MKLHLFGEAKNNSEFEQERKKLIQERVHDLKNFIRCFPYLSPYISQNKIEHHFLGVSLPKKNVFLTFFEQIPRSFYLYFGYEVLFELNIYINGRPLYLHPLKENNVYSIGPCKHTFWLPWATHKFTNSDFWEFGLDMTTCYGAGMQKLEISDNMINNNEENFFRFEFKFTEPHYRPKGFHLFILYEEPENIRNNENIEKILAGFNLPDDINNIALDNIQN